MTKIKIVVFALALIVSCSALSERDTPHVDLYSLNGFHSANLAYHIIKEEDLPHYEAMFGEIDLTVLMGRKGFTPQNLTAVFGEIAKQLKDLPDMTSVAPENVLLALTITKHGDSNRMKDGDFIGSMSIQKLKPAAQEEDDVFRELAQNVGLFNLGISNVPASYGQGFAKEACNAVSTQFFHSVKNYASALVWSTLRSNVASVKVAEGCGFHKFTETKNKDGVEGLDLLHYVRMSPSN